MLTIDNLSVYYKKEKYILKDLSLSMEIGKIHGLVGLNGEGKTTLLNTIYGFIDPVTGNILYNNQPIKRKDIAYLETENFFYPYMTGIEYLSLFKKNTNSFDTEGWEQLFSLPLNDITENYSTGMRKKLALLAVLKQDKSIFILDEPFNGLDLESTYLLNMILRQLREKGKTILITSHIYESLTTCCDYIHYLTEGRITESYTTQDFHLLQQEIKEIIEKRSGNLIDRLFKD